LGLIGFFLYLKYKILNAIQFHAKFFGQGSIFFIQSLLF